MFLFLSTAPLYQGNRNKLLLLVLLFLFTTMPRIHAQDCIANAGGSVTICGSSTTLTGTVSGTLGHWTFISGPVTPVIARPDSLITNVSGMTENGDYTFRLSHPCGGDTAVSEVTVTAHPRPAGFTAGPDKTGICATTGMTTLSGVIPAGYTGSWSAVHIYSYLSFGTLTSVNSSFSAATSATPVFALINKANHQTDPGYYAILTIISNDGQL
jgi:hypothetical protein